MTPRKKKLVLEQILKDLEQMNVLDSPMKVSHLQAKIISLQKSYECAKFVEASMGAGKSGFAYMEIMGEIFKNSTSASTSSLTTVYQSSLPTQLSSTIYQASSSPVASSSSANAQASISEPTPVNDEHRWSDGQVCALLDCYANRMEELEHPKKKSSFYSNLLEDLQPLGIFNRAITAVQLEKKMTSLLTAYKGARDNQSRTGRGPTQFKFMERMTDIFGTRPIIENSHTKNLYGEQIDALPVRISKKIPDETLHHDNGVLILSNPGEDDQDNVFDEGKKVVFRCFLFFTVMTGIQLSIDPFSPLNFRIFINATT